MNVLAASRAASARMEALGTAEPGSAPAEREELEGIFRLAFSGLRLDVEDFPDAARTAIEHVIARSAPGQVYVSPDVVALMAAAWGHGLLSGAIAQDQADDELEVDVPDAPPEA